MTASTLRLDRARTDYAALGDRLRYLSRCGSRSSF